MFLLAELHRPAYCSSELFTQWLPTRSGKRTPVLPRRGPCARTRVLVQLTSRRPVDLCCHTTPFPVSPPVSLLVKAELMEV